MRSYAEKLIGQADAKAEELIGWVRIAIALILAATAFGLASVGEVPPGAALNTLALAVFIILATLAIGVCAVITVRKGRYRSWMAWGFGLADIGLVSLNLYLAFAISGASSTLALSTPAALLACVVFIFQMFRYRVRLQLTLSICMVLMIAFLVFMRPMETVQGANIEFLQTAFTPTTNTARIVLYALIAGLAVFAVWRARRLLFEVAHQTEVQRNTTRFLPSELGHDLNDAALAELQEGRLVPLAIVFVDIRGFTHMSEALGASDTGAFLTEFRSIVTDCTADLDCIIDKFIGDGALIIFGLHTDLAQGCQDAVTFARMLLMAVNEWSNKRLTDGKEEIRIVVAIHAGDVIAGAIGDMRRLEFSVVGGTVNEASRIEAYAKSKDLELVVSQPVLTSSGLTDGWESLGRQSLRGASQPIELSTLRIVRR
ncbi:adenylate/guanylate cyclase domain-containing protein [uncultured Tateyamaria sp.]|uniref:adenylate/guanylate cyclase domain-containing protein n=1 Tax=uncultured Tateyamaria sp. TaxID=455651 RepID=UPI00260A3F16|nr:adenylate/guanylate cyclase domain-containing protein [uncultured Tateyamaria sp.]